LPVYLLIGTCKKTVFQEYRVANDMHVKVIHADEVHTKSPKAEGFRQRVRYNVTVRFFLIYAKPM
jgi:UDP-2,3-diacylglucosamine pyrophosphatase LpxH